MPQLRAVADLVKQVQFKAAQHQFIPPGLAQPVKGLQQQVEQGAVFLMVGGKLVDQLGGVESAGRKPEVGFQGQKAVDGLAPDKGIQVTPAGQRDLAVGEQLKVPGELAPGAAHSLGDGLNLAQVGGVEGKDSICLPQPGLFDNYGFRLVGSWLGHGKMFLFDSRY